MLTASLRRLWVFFAIDVCFPLFPSALLAAHADTTSSPTLTIELPAPPTRAPGAAAKSEDCLECHAQVADQFQGDKHKAADFYCVTCHGESAAHLAMDVEGTMPDRAWRHWSPEKNRYEWRMDKATLEIARFCASCHGRPPQPGQDIKTISWQAYLKSRHGQGVIQGNPDAPTCSDCHFAHGAGAEPMAPDKIVERCAVCHGDKEMMKRNGIDPDVVDLSKSDMHGTMPITAPEQKASCLDCHKPHSDKAPLSRKEDAATTKTL
ncbi:MAG: cytochrome c3 family protein [Candidatus Sumerlaeota bacterium]|nr:cytochrome c3 family protein [Candidatus Sumerlaeota bacterium]